MDKFKFHPEYQKHDRNGPLIHSAYRHSTQYPRACFFLDHLTFVLGLRRTTEATAPPKKTLKCGPGRIRTFDQALVGTNPVRPQIARFGWLKCVPLQFFTFDFKTNKKIATIFVSHNYIKPKRGAAADFISPPGSFLPQGKLLHFLEHRINILAYFWAMRARPTLRADHEFEGRHVA
jgi:hypothetical protein